MTAARPIPTLKTERLILRPPVLADIEPYCDILMSERARFMGGPLSHKSAYLDFCEGLAGWQLRGFGTLSITLAGHDDFLGLIYIHHEFGDPEREIGWVLSKAAEGRGYALEAATAARDYVFSELGWTTAVSYIDRANRASIRLAAKLGAVLDPAADRPEGYPECQVYRHPHPQVLA